MFNVVVRALSSPTNDQVLRRQQDFSGQLGHIFGRKSRFEVGFMKISDVRPQPHSLLCTCTHTPFVKRYLTSSLTREQDLNKLLTCGPQLYVSAVERLKAEIKEKSVRHCVVVLENVACFRRQMIGLLLRNGRGCVGRAEATH